MTDPYHRHGGDDEPRTCSCSPVPDDLMAIYVACDQQPGDTDRLVAEFGEVFGAERRP